MKKVINILFLITFLGIIHLNASTTYYLNNDSIKGYKLITKLRLVKLIDSVLELEEVTCKELDQLNYYASVLAASKTDSVKIYDNLSELSIYSKADETVLFPTMALDSLPSSFELILENNYLSFYNSPCKGIVTSNFGWRDGRMHKGIDIDLKRGDPVTAAFDGKVRIARRQGGFGNVVILVHPNGLETVYAHLHKLKVKSGDVVLSGQTIGLGGNTGHSRGNHLHFEMRYKGHPINPGAVLSFTEHKVFYSTITLKVRKTGLCAFPSNSSIHEVARGDSWHLIANKYGLSTKELMALNGIGKRYYLKVGQLIRIN